MVVHRQACDRSRGLLIQSHKTLRKVCTSKRFNLCTSCNIGRQMCKKIWLYRLQEFQSVSAATWNHLWGRTGPAWSRKRHPACRACRINKQLRASGRLWKVWRCCEPLKRLVFQTCCRLRNFLFTSGVKMVHVNSRMQTSLRYNLNI